MTPDEQYRETVLIAAIDNVEKAIEVIIAGIEISLEELHSFREYFSQLIEAQNNLRSGQYIVSMAEYGKIRIEIKKMHGFLKEKDLAFVQMKQYLKNKRHEAELLRRELKYHRNITRRGVVLEFRR